MIQVTFLPYCDIEMPYIFGLLYFFACLTKGTAGLLLANSGWGQMDTSLKCGEDQMQLKAMGPGSSYFMLDMGMFNCAYDVCTVMLSIIEVICA